MDRSLSPVEWKVEASAGKHTQVELPLIGEAPSPTLMDADIVARATFNGCLADAARHSGMEDQQLAEKLHISAGYMSRFMRGVGQQWAKRVVLFMRTTGSLAPLQWIAHQLGCEVIVTSEVQRQRNELLARLADLERRERMAA